MKAICIIIAAVLIVLAFASYVFVRLSKWSITFDGCDAANAPEIPQQTQSKKIKKLPARDARGRFVKCR